jgi:hypothetical protein
MAISINLTTTTGLDETFVLDWPDDVMARVLAWATAAYPALNPETGALEAQSPRDALKSACRGLAQGVSDNVTRWEREESLKAVAAPAPIEIPASPANE